MFTAPILFILWETAAAGCILGVLAILFTIDGWICPKVRR